MQSRSLCSPGWHFGQDEPLSLLCCHSSLSLNAKGQPELHFQLLHPNLGVSLVQSEVLGLQSVLQTQRGTQHSLWHRGVPGGASLGSEVTLCCATPLSSQSHFGASHLSSLLTIGPGDEG